MKEEAIRTVDEYMTHVAHGDGLFIAPSGKGRATAMHQQLLRAALGLAEAHSQVVGVSRVLCGFSREGKPMVFIASHQLGVFVRLLHDASYAFEYFDLDSSTACLAIEEDATDHFTISYQADPYWTLFGRGKNVAINTFMFLMRVNPAIARQKVVATNLATQMQPAEEESPTAGARLLLHHSPDQIGIVAELLYLYQFKDGRVGFDRLVNAPRYELLAIDIDRNSQEVSDTGSFVGYLGKRLLFGRSADIQRNIDKLQKHTEDVSTVVVTIQSAAGVRIRLRTELNQQNAARFDEFVFTDPKPAPAPAPQTKVVEVPAKPVGMTLNDIELLKQLANLVQAGVLTEAEFAAKKKQILGI